MKRGGFISWSWSAIGRSDDDAVDATPSSSASSRTSGVASAQIVCTKLDMMDSFPDFELGEKLWREAMNCVFNGDARFESLRSIDLIGNDVVSPQLSAEGLAALEAIYMNNPALRSLCGVKNEMVALDLNDKNLDASKTMILVLDLKAAKASSSIKVPGYKHAM